MFQVAIVHHLDMPIMRQRAFHVAPGTENQIPITPTQRELGFYPSWGNILQGKNYFGQDKKYEDVKASHYPMVAVVIYWADF